MEAKKIFKIFERPKTKCREFDKEKITVTKAGQTYNVYEMIQANRDETEIYKVIEKYGTIQPMCMDVGKVYGQFKEMTLMDVLGQQKVVNDMWLNLPLEVRDEFNNDIHNFRKNGENWLENKQKEKMKQTQLQENNTQTQKNKE